MKGKWFSEEQIIRILQEAEAGLSVAGVCRNHNWSEQSIRARQQLASRISVIRFNCGIDIRFYKIKANYSDVPETHLSSIEELVNKPYVVMLGDQQRYDKDALELIK